jgi:hypothetical protein
MQDHQTATNWGAKYNKAMNLHTQTSPADLAVWVWNSVGIRARPATACLRAISAPAASLAWQTTVETFRGHLLPQDAVCRKAIRDVDCVYVALMVKDAMNWLWRISRGRFGPNGCRSQPCAAQAAEHGRIALFVAL